MTQQQKHSKIIQADFGGGAQYEDQEIKINPEFQKLIPPLEEEEFLGLEKNILANGCEDPIKIWNGYIVDGHNRYEICKKHGVKFRTEEKDFESAKQAKIWMIDLALDQRNLATYARGDLIAEKQDILFPSHQGKRTDLEDEDTTSVRILSKANSESSKPTRKAAKASGMSHDTYCKIKYLRENTDDETKLKLKIGKTSINREYNALRGAAKTKQAISMGFPTDKQYDIFYCEPYSRNALVGSGWKHDPGSYILADLPVASAQQLQSKLFMWCPPTFLEGSLKLMKSWGFEYNNMMCWELDEPFEERMFKVKYLLILVGSSGARKEPPFRAESFIKNKGAAAGSRHDQVRDVIDEMFPDGNKLEIITKCTPKANWDSYNPDKEGKYENQE